MKTVTSVSGGQTSAYIAANYPSDYLLFSLVTTSDKNCLYPDKKIRQLVSDKIGKEFIGTLEDDLIIKTMLDLEQFLGQKINWVSGITYDEVVKSKGGWLPNKLHRYCTTHLKIEPMFYWWAENIGTPVKMQIGFRANEISRANTMLEKCNSDGFIEFKATFEKHKNGNNKWETIEWQKPVFPLIHDSVFKDNIVEFWKDKPVKFAPLNNCVGCFHRNPIILKKMFNEHPNKMEWFCEQEKKKGNGTWRSDVSYEKIKNHKTQLVLNFEDFGDCDTGYCEMN